MSPKVSDEHRESKRKEILQAAMRVFIRQGYHAATMKDVVEESGLSRGGVYLYFSSTEEMMLALLEEMDRENENQAEELLRRHRTVGEAIDSLLGHLLEELVHIREGAIPVVFETFAAEWRRQTFGRLLERRYASAVSRFAELLRVGERRGEFRPRLPAETIAKMFVSFNDGLMADAMQFGAEAMDARGQIEAYRLSLRYLLGAAGRAAEA
ncbi:putative HTH-type transcriptional regulator YfiR [Cohnella xylanilytica]|uniref:TetR family transcriptional regulator n=1 Tax=Cohnella xylanilytica TaxID=557555 RepID=A0A841TNX3_9BACL|nr:TetR family transcriptional regulator [Cohnella xylanilytica]MBB6689967.1 TetR family transcriptional regulator [Cohnella xylanilytica]GIO13005.1 putative HTH-type transcriptional regulator YfiR [Cohnella xylanilytica]